jgi:hypothetical protein
MKNLFSLLSALSLIFLISCSDEQLHFETEKIQQKSDLPCEETCTNISIDVDLASGNFVADSINSAVFEKVKSIVYFGEIPLEASEYSDLTNSFIKAFDDFKTEFPDDFMMPWEANVTSKLQFQSANLIQIRIDYDTFTGGAHGMFASNVLSFDALTGKQLKTKDFFKDLDGLKKMATEKFRTEFKIPKEQSLVEAGYFFQNEDFVLPENVFFSKKGITFHYNVYEIASYAQGAIILNFTNEEIKPFLKIE